MNISFFSDRKITHKKKLLRFAEKVCGQLKKFQEQGRVLSSGKGEISVIFVSDQQIKKLNQTYFKKNRPTDVIAFRYKSPKFKVQSAKLRTSDFGLRTSESLPFGDICISLDTAKRQAEAGKHSLSQELALLLLHGLLHLAGYEDSPPAQKKKMFHMQKKLFLELAPELAPPDQLR